MIPVKKIVISIIILGIASLSLVEEDIAKFLLSGHSATYNMFLIRHSSFVVFAISLVVILFIFLLQKGKVYKWLLGLSLVVWILSQRTYTIQETDNTTFIFGFAVIPVHTCTLSPENTSGIKLDFIMAKEIEKAIEANR